MKTKFKLLLLLTLVFSSCFTGSDDNPEPPVFENPLELTSVNYIYEGHLRTRFINQTMANNQVEIDELEPIVNEGQASPEQEETYYGLIEQQEVLTTELDGILDLEGIGGIIPELPPIPLPSPCDPGGPDFLGIGPICISLDAIYAIAEDSVEKLEITLLTLDGNEIITMSSFGLETMPGYESVLKFQELVVNNGFEGEINIRVIKSDALSFDEYMVEGILINL